MSKEEPIKLRCPEFLSKPGVTNCDRKRSSMVNSPLSSEPSTHPVYKKVGRVKKLKFFHTTFSCNLYPIGFPHFLKQLIQLRREVFKGFFLLPIHRFRIYVHRSLDVLVPHDGLDHFEIVLHLTESGRKGMPELMAGKFRKHNLHWLPAGNYCSFIQAHTNWNLSGADLAV